MKKFYLVLTVSVVAIGICVGGYALKSNNTVLSGNNNIVNKSSADTLLTIDSKADMTGPAYDSIKSLKDGADIIIKGTVIDANSFERETKTLTKSHIRVDKSYKGDVKVGDTLTFVEAGGITYFQNLREETKAKLEANGKISVEEKKKPIKVTLNGVSPVAKDENVLLYAKKCTDGFYMPETCYSPLALTSGKFIINGSRAERKETEDMKKLTIDLDLNEIK